MLKNPNSFFMQKIGGIMKNKTIKILLFLFVGIISVFVTMKNVKAETYNGGFGDGDYIPTRVYINKAEPSGYTRWQRARTLIQYHG